MNLGKYKRQKVSIREKLRFVSWYFLGPVLFSFLFPFSRVRVVLLKAFGAKIGVNVVVSKQGIKIKYPWNLSIGDNTWVGENVWIDNLAHVSIGNNCCISQGVYFCTGNHDWKRDSFDLILKEVLIEDEVWIGAMSRLAPGTVVKEGTVVQMGSVVLGTLESHGVYGGNSITRIKDRPPQI